MQPEHQRGLNFDLGQPYTGGGVLILWYQKLIYFIYMIKLRAALGHRAGFFLWVSVCVHTLQRAPQCIKSSSCFNLVRLLCVCMCLFFLIRSIRWMRCARAAFIIINIRVLSERARARLPRDAKAAAAAFLILRSPQRRAAHPRRRNPLTVTISNWKFISPRAVCSTYKRIISVCFHQMITPESFPRNWDETFSRTLLRWERKEIHLFIELHYSLRRCR